MENKMATHDLLVNNDGSFETLNSVGKYQITSEIYRLYHFLYDLETILKVEKDDKKRLQLICPLVRRLLMSSYWLQNTVRRPDPETGWSVVKLYDEPLFPWTLQNVCWQPGKISEIHNHATWAIIAFIQGQEKNTFWRPSNNTSAENLVEKVSERTFVAGDVVAMMPDVIHNIESLSDTPTITFTLYGQTQGDIIYFNPAPVGCVTATANQNRNDK
jgi:predicted metal-dependent enzyme (double-stranded beta helix superfamily)